MPVGIMRDKLRFHEFGSENGGKGGGSGDAGCGEEGGNVGLLMVM